VIASLHEDIAAQKSRINVLETQVEILKSPEGNIIHPSDPMETHGNNITDHGDKTKFEMNKASIGKILSFLNHFVFYTFSGVLVFDSENRQNSSADLGLANKSKSSPVVLKLGHS
jgi:hypothetical protein